MIPKKNLIEAAVKSGAMDRMNLLLSAAHLLNCEANMLFEEASDIMAQSGLLLGDLKKLHNNFVKGADRYFKEFSTMAERKRQKWICSPIWTISMSGLENGQKSLRLET